MINSFLNKKNIFFVIFLLAIPLKLTGDILSYLYDKNIPSTTVFASTIAISVAFYVWNIFKIKRIDKILILLFFYIYTISIIYQSAFSGNYRSFDEKHLNGIFSSGILYFIYMVSGIFYRKSEEKYVYPMAISIAFATASVLSFQFKGVDVWSKLNESGAYLRIADLYSLMVLLLLPSVRWISIRIIIIIVSSLTLLLIGSRSSLLFFIGSILIFFLLESSSIKKIFTILLYGTFLIITLFFIVNFFEITALERIYTEIENSRIFYTIYMSPDNGGGDARSLYLHQGLARIQENSFSGNWLLRLQTSDGGDYIHNILYILDDYGAFTFTLLITLILRTTHKIYLNSRSSGLELAFVFSILSMLFTRAYGFPYVFFFIGWMMTLKDGVQNLNGGRH